MNVDYLLQATKEELPPARFEHTIRVMDTALELAERTKVDLTSVRIAAVLHDYCKFWSVDKLMSWINQYHLPSDLLQFHKELWHAPVGAEVAKRQFSITDGDILNAIRYHTTGRPSMSTLEKIIYLADLIEPGRRFPGVDEVRELATADIDQAVLESFNNSILFLIDKGQKIYPLTLAARNEMLDAVLTEDTKEE